MRSSYPTLENTVFFHEEDIVKAYNLYINFTEKEIAEIYKDSPDDLAFLLLAYGSNKVVDGFISLSQKESAILTLLNKYDIINYNHSFNNKTELSSIIGEAIDALALENDNKSIYKDLNPSIFINNATLMMRQLANWTTNSSIRYKVIDIQKNGIDLVYKYLLKETLKRYPDIEDIKYGVLVEDKEEYYHCNQKYSKFSKDFELAEKYRAFINFDMNYMKLYESFFSTPPKKKAKNIESKNFRYKQLLFLSYLIEVLYNGNNKPFLSCIKSTSRITFEKFKHCVLLRNYNSTLNITCNDGLKRLAIYGGAVTTIKNNSDITPNCHHIYTFDSDRMIFGITDTILIPGDKLIENDQIVCNNKLCESVRQKVKNFISSCDILNEDKDLLLEIYDLTKTLSPDPLIPLSTIFKYLYVFTIRKHCINDSIDSLVIPYDLKNETYSIVNKTTYNWFAFNIGDLDKNIVGDVFNAMFEDVHNGILDLTNLSYSRDDVFAGKYVYSLIFKTRLSLYNKKFNKKESICKEFLTKVYFNDFIDKDVLIKGVYSDMYEQFNKEAGYAYDTLARYYGSYKDPFDKNKTIERYYREQIVLQIEEQYKKNFWRIEKLISDLRDMIYEINCMGNNMVKFEGNINDFFTKIAYYFSVKCSYTNIEISELNRKELK